jgi:hypothetical protein
MKLYVPGKEIHAHHSLNIILTQQKDFPIIVLVAHHPMSTDNKSN